MAFSHSLFSEVLRYFKACLNIDEWSLLAYFDEVSLEKYSFNFHFTYYYHLNSTFEQSSLLYGWLCGFYRQVLLYLALVGQRTRFNKRNISIVEIKIMYQPHCFCLLVFVPRRRRRGTIEMTLVRPFVRPCFHRSEILSPQLLLHFPSDQLKIL